MLFSSSCCASSQLSPCTRSLHESRLRCRLHVWSLRAGDPRPSFRAERSNSHRSHFGSRYSLAYCCEAILLPGLDSRAVFHAKTFASCKPAGRDGVLCWPELCLLPLAWFACLLACLLGCCCLASRACWLACWPGCCFFACLHARRQAGLGFMLACLLASRPFFCLAGLACLIPGLLAC